MCAGLGWRCALYITQTVQRVHMPALCVGCGVWWNAVGLGGACVVFAGILISLVCARAPVGIAAVYDEEQSVALPLNTPPRWGSETYGSGFKTHLA